MTAVFMEGFESVIDELDLNARGWRSGYIATYSNQNAFTVPSRTGTPGKGLLVAGPYYGTSTSYLPHIGDVDFPMVDTGQTIYGLWQTGGFAVGFNATFNKVNQIQLAHGYAYQIVYDGAQYYWALGQNNAGTWTVFYSTDLVNWTQVVTAPSGALATSNISVFGSGPSATVVVYNKNLTNTTYYSNNLGLTWTLFPTNGTAACYSDYIIANRSTQAPYVHTSWISSVGRGLFYSNTLTGTQTRIGSLLLEAAPQTYVSGWGKYMNGVMLFNWMGGGTSITSPNFSTVNFWYSCQESLDPTNAANWVKSATSTLGMMSDIAYFPVTGLWYAAGYGGIASASQTGTTANPTGPVSAWSTVLTTSGVTVWSIATNGTILVAVGNDPVTTTIPALWTSTDGVTWIKQSRFIFAAPGGVGSNNYTNVIWDGHQFVLVGGTNMNVIAVSPDGIAWTSLYYPDYTEAAAAGCASPMGIFSGTFNAGTYVGAGNGGAGTYAPWSTSLAAPNYVGVGFNCAPVVSTNGVTSRIVTGVMVPCSTNTATVLATAAAPVVPTAQLSHYYEIIATATATKNQFNIQFAVDGILVPGTYGPYNLALASDVGSSHLLINLPRTGNWTVIDDIYLTTQNGANNIGQLGVTQVLPWIPASDSQAQFTKNGSLASDALTVASPISNAEGYVYSSTVGAKDVYNMSNAIPAGYRVRAVQAEAYFTKYGSTGANGSVGIVSGATELDSAQVPALTTTPAYGVVLSETDPNTGAAWTVAAAQAAKVAVNKVT